MGIHINKILNTQSAIKNNVIKSVLLKLGIMFLICIGVHIVLTKVLNIIPIASLLICIALFILIFIIYGKIITEKIKKCPLVDAEVISCEKVEVRGDLYNDLQFKYYNVTYSFTFNNKQRTTQSTFEKKIQVGKKTKGYYDVNKNTFTDESIVKQFYVSKLAYVIIAALFVVAGILIVYPMI